MVDGRSTGYSYTAGVTAVCRRRGEQSLLIVTGPPGAGKSTAAAALARRSVRGAYVEADWFWTTLVSGFIEPWRPDADSQNRTVMRSVMAAAAELDLGGYDTVVDGIVGPWMFDVLGDMLGDPRTSRTSSRARTSVRDVTARRLRSHPTHVAPVRGPRRA